MSSSTDTFFSRMDDLREQVGRGLLEGEVEVNQVYAHYQDSGFSESGIPAAEFEHPRGGEAGYLSDELTRKGPEVAQRLADSIGEERPMAGVMIHVTEDVAAGVYIHAPREYWILRNSASSKVKDDGRDIFLKPALIPRLTQAELDAIRRAAGGDVIHESERQHTTGFQPGFQHHGTSISGILRRRRAGA